MLRLSNPVETLTTLTFAASIPGHQTSVNWLRRYLGWRGCRDNACLLLVGATGSKETVSHALRGVRQFTRQHQAIYIGQSIGRKWKENRFRNVYIRNKLWQKGYAVDTVETAVNWNRVGDMMRAVEEAAHTALGKEGERIHCHAHLSHFYAQGASVYTTFFYRLAGDFERDMLRWQGLKQAVSQAIVAQGGTISHQHGVGTDHAPYLACEKGELGMQAIRSLFRPFDPDGIMNPGKLLV
jgi:alkyldihydroxyacetonephosphate synthase